MSAERGQDRGSANAESKPSAEMAFLLTLLFGPGMGHFYAGEIRRGVTVVGGIALLGCVLVVLAVRTRGVPVLQVLGAFLGLTLVLWVFSAVDVLRGKKRFVPSTGISQGLRLLVAGILSIALAVASSALLRVFVAEAFKVPSSSMNPTLLLGDHFFADKRAVPPVPGDVIVFTMPAQPGADFVKRVIARGHDVVRVDAEGVPTVNGVAARRCPLGRAPATAGGPPHDYFLEVLGTRRYLVVIDPASTSSAFGEYVVPGDAVFVLGDNRHNSYDSRMWNDGLGGSVPSSMVRGLAFGIWWSPGTATSTARDRALDGPMLPPFAASLQTALDACPN